MQCKSVRRTFQVEDGGPGWQAAGLIQADLHAALDSVLSFIILLAC